MSVTRFVVGMFSLALSLGIGGSFAQTYPNKLVRLVTSGVGGSNDFVARLMAPKLSANLGQPVVIDNRPVGGIAGEVVAQAPADGYTMLVQSSILWVVPLFQKQKTPDNVVIDFSPITLATRAANILVVHPSLPARSVKELIALAKARPGQLNYSSGPTANTAHLAGALFQTLAGVNIVRIPYNNASAQMVDLLSGQVQMTFASAAVSTPHIKSGKLRALGITSAQPSTMFPGLPTVGATLPGYELIAITGVWAPAKTPEAIINRLNQEIVRFLSTAEAKEQFLNAGTETVGNSPAEFAAWIKTDVARMGKLIKDAGIRED